MYIDYIYTKYYAEIPYIQKRQKKKISAASDRAHNFQIQRYIGQVLFENLSIENVQF